MKRKNEKTNDTTKRGNDNDLPAKKNVTNKAREEAMEDIDEDPDLSIHSPNDDLDEGETARLGDDKTDLI